MVPAASPHMNEECITARLAVVKRRQGSVAAKHRKLTLLKNGRALMESSVAQLHSYTALFMNVCAA
jgi:hypothetical protein